MGYEEMVRANFVLRRDWGRSGDEIAKVAYNMEHRFDGTIEDFVGLCCGGNRPRGAILVGFLEARVGQVWPEINLPDELGENGLEDIAYLLRILGIKFDVPRFLRKAR